VLIINSLRRSLLILKITIIHQNLFILTSFIMHFSTSIALLATIPSTLACLGYTGGLPKHTGTKSLSAPRYLKKGEVFDAGWVKYDRGVKCSGQSEGGKQL
jgi:hypothetical protein